MHYVISARLTALGHNNWWGMSLTLTIVCVISISSTVTCVKFAYVGCALMIYPIFMLLLILREVACIQIVLSRTHVEISWWWS